MRIGIDARALKWPKTGIGKYILRIIRFIDEETDDDLVLFCDFPIDSPQNFKGEKVVFTAPKRFIWENNLLPVQIKKYDIDVYHAAWNYGLTKSIGCPTLLTVHDLIPVILQDLYFNNIIERIFYRTMYLQSMRSSVDRADFINVDSNNTKNDLIKLFNVLDHKIRVVHMGCDEVFRVITDSSVIDEAIKKYGVKKPYAIYGGGFDVRKNLIRLLDAFKSLKADNPDLSLVMIGEIDDYAVKVKKHAKDISLSGDVVFTGYVSEEDLAALINGANFAVYPSLYEGFGLPPLEAMACGALVAASKRGSIPEILASSGVYFDPEDVKDMTRVMQLCLSDNEELELIKRFAPKRAADFSWQLTVESVYESYMQAINAYQSR